MSMFPCVYVEGVGSKAFVEAFLRGYPAEVVDGSTHSGTIAAAQFSLLDHPERPVVALLNADTESPRAVAEIRGAARRLLARANPDNWYVAIAVPRLDAWAMTDPR